MTVESNTKDKQITIEVPEDRVGEFYAFYGRFLAGSTGRGRRGRGPGPRGGHGPGDHGHRCGSHRHGRRAEDDVAAPAEQSQPAGPETTVA